MSARGLVVPGLFLLLATVAGCWVPRGPIDLREAETHVVRFGVEAPRGGICPGEPVSLDVELTAEVGSSTMRLTKNRRDLDDAIFDMRQVRFSSAQGRIDEEGRFFPSADPLVSAQSGFVFYVAVPRGPTFSVRYPPVYECATPFGREGRPGVDGPRGEDALYEDRTDGSAASAVDGELASATGFNGGGGGAGGAGPELTIYVTWVQTPDYTRLLAARAEGDVHGLTLRAPGTPLDVLARGGRGGAGGNGGQGASGLDEVRRGKRGRGHVVKSFTRGGVGGAGGNGGEGGAGGSVRVVLDDRFELESWVHVDVQGGEGGPGGRAGAGGRGGASNGAGARETSASSGLAGTFGKSGPSGANGQVSFERGDVRSHFEGLGAVVPL